MILLRPTATPPVPGQIRNLSRVWEEVLHLGVRETYRKGSKFSFPDAHKGNFGYIRFGRLCSHHPTREGLDRITFFLSDGCLFRETYVIAGYCENFPVHHCLTDVELYRFSGALLHDERFIATYPHLIRNCMYSMAVKLASHDAMIQTLGKASAMEKVAWYLDALYGYYQTATFAPGITQSELTFLLGIHQSSMTRAVLALKEHDIISTFTKTQITILDPDRLKRVAEGEPLYRKGGIRRKKG